MPRPGERRPVITDHAIAVVARGGARALTHHAVDRDAGLAPGSTSYYFRTRAALVGATIEQIRHRSRAAFDDANPPDAPTPDTAAAFIAAHLAALAGPRRDQALAVFALLPEVEADDTLRPALLQCLFSPTAAANLATALGSSNPETDARDLVALLNGLLVDLLYGSGRSGSEPARTVEAVARLLRTFGR